MKRGSVIFDESGFLSEEMMNVYSAFAIVNKTMKTGKDASGHSIDAVRQRVFPTNIPNQRFFISSASDTSTPFYGFYRQFAKRQIEGDPDYCVLHIDCNLCFNPTLKGQLVAPLLTRSQVDSEMRISPEKARREYWCQFTTDGGSNAIIKRGAITRNEEIRKPEFENKDGKTRYILTYDPARIRDNSIVTVAALYENDKNDIIARLVDCQNLMDVGKKIKSPMQIPDQVNYLRQMILSFNGGDFGDGFSNIAGVWIDAGAGGGGGGAIADELLQDWTDKKGVRHHGFIDKQYSAEYISRYPNAYNILHFMSPAGYKSMMYEALIEMINQDKIKFTPTYDNKGYLTIFNADMDKFEAQKKKIEEKYRKRKNLNQEQIEDAVNEQLKNIQAVHTKTVKLDWKDELALANIDAMKEQLVNIVRKKRENGRDSFELAPEKARKMHDDRAYTACLLGWALMQERRKRLLVRRKPILNLVDKLPIRKASYM